MKHGSGIKELELLNIEWQLDHHSAKQKHRQKIVDSLDIQSGDIVLDLGCGAGLWSSLFAEKVKPHGKVIGVDMDSRWIEYAQQNLKENPLQSLIEYQVANLNELDFKDNTFDLVFISGCSPYLADINAALNKQKRIIKAGGKIADRSWDDGMFIVHPINPLLSAKVMLAIAQASEAINPNIYFDNYFGRKSHSIFKDCGFKDVKTTSYSVQMLAPLSEVEKRYIRGNAQLYEKISAPYLSAEDIKQWSSSFDPNSEEYVLDRDDVYYGILEVLTTGIL
ncbi:Methyltransferase type 11 [[Leptolyngbya] sp. PCC 7376]|uniref:class I SAM-dependent methyltransferase n=1 Tax=[Leptolyngbya] sp. PCC 7376 TaxID=111781 RepID=UPI00029F3FEB|nr:methyltransferase domain-containing protein [[Leptolyngbya] sp. PCC 7376]AFY40091.1 Methyltransferase type 11 [[Leptolyngbya] sp. PCC 7376]